MNEKILLPVFLITTTITATEIASKVASVKTVAQAPEELFSLKLLNTTKRARVSGHPKCTSKGHLKMHHL